METTGNYIFWAAIYIAITALVYWLMVRRPATPGQNRWFILTGLTASILFGAIGIIPIQRTAETAAFSYIILPEVVVGASEALDNTGKELYHAISTRSLLLYASFGITLLLAARMFGSIAFLLARIRINRRISISGCTVLPMKKNVAPFSFFGFVFIPESMLSDKQLGTVLIHEKVHIRKKHSFDLIFVELLTLVFWFHPAIWYLRRELKLQHEYEADRCVLKQQIEKTSYQKMLLNMSLFGSGITMANPFNYSPLKKRIMMMNKNFQGNHAKAILSMFAVIPLFATIIVLQSCKQQPEADTEKGDKFTVVAEDDVVTDTVYNKVAENPSFPGGMQEMVTFLREHIVYPEEARKAGTQGTVFVTFVVKADGKISDVQIAQGVTPELDNEAKRVVEIMPDWEPGRLECGKAVNVKFNLPVRFQLDNDNETTEKIDFADEIDKLVFERKGILKNGMLLIINGDTIDINEEQHADMDKLIPYENADHIKIHTGDRARSLDRGILIDVKLKDNSEKTDNN